MVIFAFFFYNASTSVVASVRLLERDPIASLAELDFFFLFCSLVFSYLAIAKQLDPCKYSIIL